MMRRDGNFDQASHSRTAVLKTTILRSADSTNIICFSRYKRSASIRIVLLSLREKSADAWAKAYGGDLTAIGDARRFPIPRRSDIREGAC
jgi:hypothetical protein